MRWIFGIALLASSSVAGEIGSYLTFDNQPMGSEERPLVMRTYLPNIELEPLVLANHAQGNETPRYSAKTGLLSTDSNDQPVPGIPAGIAVNMGPKLSFVWDTTECRLLYAWADGFLDMESYWGTPDRGSRKKNDYVPRLIGQLFFKAQSAHPLSIDGKRVTEVRYTGHSRQKGVPTFRFEANGYDVAMTVLPGKDPQTLKLSYECSGELFFEMPNTALEVLESEGGKFEVLVRPNAAETFTGFKKEVIEITEANPEAGEKLYNSLGCVACHTKDGGRAHGPTFYQLAGSERELIDGSKTTADAAYLVESIKAPNAKHVKDYPAGMMPAYPLNDLQIDSLVLYIETLK
ncbi:MAG: cytochrome c [Verrucomicrobiota bacterium]